MARWIVLLRAVNVGQRRYPMAELRQVLTAAGYGDVATYIQTGNVVLTSPRRSRTALEGDLDALLSAERGFPVEAIALTPAELTALAAELDAVERDAVERDAAEWDAAGAGAPGHYVSVLRHAPNPAQVAELERPRSPHERVVVRGRNVHALLRVPYHEAKLSDLAVERVAGCASTSRNDRVIRALAARWGG